MRPVYQAWVWFDHNGEPVFVGCGRAADGPPWRALWDRRDKYDSPLTLWLRSLQAEPKRKEYVITSQSDASAIAAQLAEQYGKQGFRLLSARPHDSYAGGGEPRRVMDPYLMIFDSVRQAAAVYDVNPSTITRWCQTRDGWDYIGA